MKRFAKIWVGLFLLSPVLLGAQTNSPQNTPVPAAVGPVNSGDPMLTPPLVSGQSFPISFASEERSNYLRYGLAFTTAYTDNALGALAGHPVSDISYSVAPMVALDETTPRLHALLDYAPGFTFYQRNSSLNEQDQNAAVNFSYRLSPHVTFSARDSFQKSSNIFNQPDLAADGTVSGGTQEANLSVIAPIADRLSNSGNVGITAQIAANAMVGVSGTFNNLHYPDQAQVPGLFDSSSQAAAAFYSLRVSTIHYVGVTYQYQRLLSYPTEGQNETQTNAVLLFYTLSPSSKFSVSVFAGPQYANVAPQFTDLGPTPLLSSESWHPAAGGSMNFQGRLSAVAISYAHMISGSGGLIGAVRQDAVNASFRQQLLRMLSASIAGGYAQNDILTSTPVFGQNGHTISATASLQQQIRQHLNVQLGYTRLHQDYSSVAVLAANPNTNREFISLSYQFSRPLGR